MFALLKRQAGVVFHVKWGEEVAPVDAHGDAMGGQLLCGLVLRIKLRLGKKLCKLQARFLATVNNVNYTVNYK